MTVVSNWIEVRRPDGIESGFGDTIGKMFQRWMPVPPRGPFSPRDLQRWARAHNRGTFQVDPCWYRVDVLASDLLHFLEEAYGVDDDFTVGLRYRLQAEYPRNTYVLNAEEYQRASPARLGPGPMLTANSE